MSLWCAEGESTPHSPNLSLKAFHRCDFSLLSGRIASSRALYRCSPPSLMPPETLFPDFFLLSIFLCFSTRRRLPRSPCKIRRGRRLRRPRCCARPALLSLLRPVVACRRRRHFLNDRAPQRLRGPRVRHPPAGHVPSRGLRGVRGWVSGYPRAVARADAGAGEAAGHAHGVRVAVIREDSGGRGPLGAVAEARVRAGDGGDRPIQRTGAPHMARERSGHTPLPTHPMRWATR